MTKNRITLNAGKPATQETFVQTNKVIDLA